MAPTIGAWKTTLDLAVYLADLVAKITTIIFSSGWLPG